MTLGARMREPEISDELISAHGLAADEYQKILEIIATTIPRISSPIKVQQLGLVEFYAMCLRWARGRSRR